MTTPSPRTGHPYLTYDELRGQPAAVAEALAADAAQRVHIARELAGTHQLTDVTVGPGFLLPTFTGRGRIYLAGCGTAHHAAQLGAQWFRHLSQGALEVVAAQSFEFANYDVQGPRTHDAFLALSHSGTASATVAAARHAKEALGMYTVALTADPTSPLAAVCDETLVTNPPTVAATYTVSHLAMLTVLADLAQKSAEHLRAGREVALELADDIAAFPDLTRAALAAEPDIQTIVNALPELTQLVLAGGGPNYITALEGALKVREAAYLPATGWEIEEILHGPFASFDEHTAAVLIAPQGTGRDRALDVLRAFAHIGVTTIALGSSGDEELAALATHSISLPDSVELFSVIPATVAVQEIAYWLAIKRGTNPDLIRKEDPRYAAARQSYTR
ncbi:MAG: SIS domain-containing protein [Ktedonobacterales bacterium]|nr:SIS domain-containing protein [Ktedonobacterales bacterium]